MGGLLGGGGGGKGYVGPPSLIFCGGPGPLPPPPVPTIGVQYVIFQGLKIILETEQKCVYRLCGTKMPVNLLHMRNS